MDINYNKIYDVSMETYKKKRENNSKLETIIEVNENEILKKTKNKNVICANCGEKGHVVKDCTGPITSFGIMAFKIIFNKEQEKYDKNSKLDDILSEFKDNIPQKDQDQAEIYPKIKFLMIQRKDTMGYIDFIRGKYNNTDEEEKFKKINICLNEMTFKEKDNLLTQTFDQIWNNLWVNHDSKCYKNEYETAKRKFNQLNVRKLVEESKTKYTFQEFGFAKGRRNMKESNIACAEREFYEETRYNKSSYEFIKDYPSIHEEFTGTNSINYRHIYYLVKMKSTICPPKIDLTNKVQAGEVKNIGWFTFDECNMLLRPYDTAKINVLKNVYNDILKMNLNFKCSNNFKNNQSQNTMQKKSNWSQFKQLHNGSAHSHRSIEYCNSNWGHSNHWQINHYSSNKHLNNHNNNNNNNNNKHDSHIKTNLHYTDANGNTAVNTTINTTANTTTNTTDNTLKNQTNFNNLNNRFTRLISSNPSIHTHTHTHTHTVYNNNKREPSHTVLTARATIYTKHNVKHKNK